MRHVPGTGSSPARLKSNVKWGSKDKVVVDFGELWKADSWIQILFLVFYSRKKNAVPPSHSLIWPSLSASVPSKWTYRPLLPWTRCPSQLSIDHSYWSQRTVRTLCTSAHFPEGWRQILRLFKICSLISVLTKIRNKSTKTLKETSQQEEFTARIKTSSSPLITPLCLVKP